ncbi:MAG: hypothetical protein WCZ87_11430 [Thiohalobacteraceae bacterium]
MTQATLKTTHAVLTLADIGTSSTQTLLRRYGMQLGIAPADSLIPGSFWGGSEAGLIDDRLLARSDTPVHSILHEACHYICMDANRRAGLHTDAGGDYDEENGVCYLQILLADHLPGVGQERLMQDMDAWGYSFRLGSAARWFAEDSEDARDWLRTYELIDADGNPGWRLRS